MPNMFGGDQLDPDYDPVGAERRARKKRVKRRTKRKRKSVSAPIVLDPAVEAAHRLIARKDLPSDINNDVITMAVVILRIAGYEITDSTGEGIPNTTPKEQG